MALREREREFDGGRTIYRRKNVCMPYASQERARFCYTDIRI